MYEIKFRADAIEDLRSFRKHERNIILDAIDAQLIYEPTIETNNRFRRNPPEQYGNYVLASFVSSTMLMTMLRLFGLNVLDISQIIRSSSESDEDDDDDLDVSRIS